MSIKLGEPFGLDQPIIKKIDWDLALGRILHDLRSDFVYAPHLRYIYSKAGDQLIAQVKADLKAGAYSAGLPLTIEVPKSHKIRVAVSSLSKRLGPNFTRPGSILLPHDRILYQALADQAALVIRSKIDATRSFSHQLTQDDSVNMFLPTRTCWSSLMKALAAYAKSKTAKYILKIDVANFFGSLNLHTMINVLNDSGYSKSLSSRLEAILTNYTGMRSSRGILQGIYPSDLLGNYYLAPIDRFLEDYGVASARYVDDIYIFVSTVDEADQLMRQLIPELRNYDLSLNETKSVIMPKVTLFSEEPDLEALFSDAIEEISQQVDDEDFDADYGFQSEWEDEDLAEEEEEEGTLELEATKILFDSLTDYSGQEENIERFCLPLFAKANSNYAVRHILKSFKKRPAMSQIYASYLSKFLEDEEVYETLVGLLNDPTLMDWQRMWVAAALMQRKPDNEEPITIALKILKDANRHDALRAAAAIYVGIFGDHARRKTLSAIYSTTSRYVQAAIYFSSRNWPGAERSNAKASWGAHGELNKLLTLAMAKQPSS